MEEEDEDGKKHKLVLIRCVIPRLSNKRTHDCRNPWGRRSWNGIGEWNGAWSDGSKEWTPYWLKKLDYRFGDDGLFWMSYDDIQKRFDILDRTRLFDKEWAVVQHWTSVSVAWVTGYLNTKFLVEIKKAGPTVFVLCQVCLHHSSLDVLRAQSYAKIHLSWMNVISMVLRGNTNLTCISSYRRRTLPRASTLFEPVVPGLGTAVSPPKSIFSQANTRFVQIDYRS